MPRRFDILDGRRSLGPAAFGIVIAAEPREQDIAPLMEGYVEPVSVKFRWRHGKGNDFEVPVRPPNAVEIIMLVNRALAEKVIEFGFRQTNMPSAPPGFGG